LRSQGKLEVRFDYASGSAQRDEKRKERILCQHKLLKSSPQMELFLPARFYTGVYRKTF
jgi:hypothetical protein